MLIRALPRESAYGRAVLGAHADWTVDAHLAAVIADRLGVLIWHNTEDGMKGRNPPQRIPRPGDDNPDTPQPSVKRTPEELRAHFEELRARAREREGGE